MRRHLRNKNVSHNGCFRTRFWPTSINERSSSVSPRSVFGTSNLKFNFISQSTSPISLSFTLIHESNFEMYFGTTSGVRRTMKESAVTPPLVRAVISAPCSVDRRKIK